MKLNVEDHLNLVHYTIKKYKLYNPKYTTDYDELVNEGTIGLLKAIKNFDDSKGYQFSSYAVLFIRGAILKFYQKEKGRGFGGTRSKIEQGALELYVNTIEDYQYLPCKDDYTDEITLIALLKELPERYTPAVDYILSVYNQEGKTQMYFAKKYGTTQMTISRLRTKIQKMLENTLKNS